MIKKFSSRKIKYGSSRYFYNNINFLRPREDSNLQNRDRSPVVYPLAYEGQIRFILNESRGVGKRRAFQIIFQALLPRLQFPPSPLQRRAVQNRHFQIFRGRAQTGRREFLEHSPVKNERQNGEQQDTKEKTRPIALGSGAQNLSQVPLGPFNFKLQKIHNQKR